MLVDGHTIAEQFNAGSWKAYRDNQPVKAEDLKIGPNSIDVTLGDHLLVRDPTLERVIDPYDQSTARYVRVDPVTVTHGFGPGFVLMPNTLYLGFVRERFEARSPIRLPATDGLFKPTHAVTAYVVPMVDGRSTLARLGLTVHETAGFGDYGFEGCFTLEIRACTMMKLYVGMRIAQVSFQTVTPGVVNKVYAGAYKGADHIGAPVAPRLGKDRF